MNVKYYGGDETEAVILNNENVNNKKTHTYEHAGTYFIEIFCESHVEFPGFESVNNEWKDKLIEIVSWGLFPILNLKSRI